MRKVLLSVGLLLSVATAAVAQDFDATPFKSGVFYFRPIAADEVEYIHPSEYDSSLGAYSGSVASTEPPETVTNNGVTYRVTTIGEGAFKDATICGSNASTKIIWFNAATTTVKADAFNGWTINMLGLRASDIDPTAFRNNKINRINTNSQSVFYVSEDPNVTSSNHGKDLCGDLYKLVDGKKILWAWGGVRKVGAWTTESTTITTAWTFDYDEIGDYALYGNPSLQTVTLKSVTKIGKESFANMSKLSALTLPATLTEIGDDAFKGTTSITTVTCNATTPPSGAVFEDVVYARIRETGNINVPEAAKEAYLADENWSKFWVEPGTAKFYIAGDFTNWGDGKLEMTPDGSGGYTITIEGVTSGQEFKFVGDDGTTWYGGDAAQGETSYGVHKDWCTDIALSTTGSNFKITGSGNLTFAVSADLKLTVSGWETGVFLAGSMTSWLENKEEMAYSSGVFTITRTMEADAEFKFYDQGTATWYGTDEAGTKTITADMLGTTLTVATPGQNFKMADAGKWDITFDQTSMTLTVAKHVEALESVFQYGKLWYKPVSETEVEIAPIPGGSVYNVVLSSASELTNTVTSPNTEKEYTVVGIGEGAFKNGSISAMGTSMSLITMEFFWFPTTIKYIRAEAFNGTSSNYPGVRFNVLEELDETAFINNKINWFNPSGSGDVYKVYGSSATNAQNRGGEVYKEVDGVKTLVCYPGDRHQSVYKRFPNQYEGYPDNSAYTVTKAAYADIYNVIGKNAFYGNTNITSVTFGSMLTAIEEDAFKNVSQLRTINLPAANPPSVATDFEDAVYASGTLSLSGDAASNVEAYYNHEIWGKFFHDVTIADATGGTVTADAPYGVNGATITLTVTPDAGHEFGSITVTTANGGTLTVSGSGNTYTFTMPAADVTVTATFNVSTVELTGVEFSDGHEYATWYGEADLALPADVKAYVVSAVSGDEATITEVGYIPAATGVLLYSETEASNLSTVAYDGTTDEATSLLVGYTVDTAITDGYLLWGDAFYRALAGTLPAHRCYLPVPTDEPSPVSRVRLVQAGDSVVTGIADVNAARAGRVTYVSVTGQTSDRPFSGVNIVIAPDGTVSKMVR